MKKVNLVDAVNEVQNLNRMFKALRTVGDALEEIGKIEQYEREMLAAKDKAVKEAEAAKKEAAAAQDELKAAKDEVAAAKAKAKSLIEDGAKEACKIVDDAKAEASAVVGGAKELEAKSNDVVKVKQAKLKEIEALIADKEAELDVINKKVDEAKERIAKIMGA